MTDTTAKIRAKGLESTGITEDIANNLYANKGKSIMAIVELRSAERHEKADGTRRVDLTLELVEPAVDDDLAEHLRELTRTVYLNRQHAEGQLAIDASLGDERSVSDVLAAGQRHRPHPFLPDDAGKDTPICDVCGGIEASAVHSVQDLLDDEDDEDDVEEDDAKEDSEEGDEEEADPYSYIHTAQGAAPGADTACGLRATFGKGLVNHQDLDKVNCPECLSALDATWNDDEDQAERVDDGRVVQFSGKGATS